MRLLACMRSLIAHPKKKSFQIFPAYLHAKQEKQERKLWCGRSSDHCKRWYIADKRKVRKQRRVNIVLWSMQSLDLAPIGRPKEIWRTHLMDRNLMKYVVDFEMILMGFNHQESENVACLIFRSFFNKRKRKVFSLSSEKRCFLRV